MTDWPPSEEDAVRTLAAQVHVLTVRCNFLMEENVRLRDRIHEAVDECQRRYAPDMKELSRYRYRHVWAQEELDKYWTGQNSHVSTLSHTILENLIGRIKELEEELARRSSC